jgi:hypothetical protein
MSAPPEPEKQRPAVRGNGRANSQVNFHASDIATPDKANQPETVSAAAFREALARKAVKP